MQVNYGHLRNKMWPKEAQNKGLLELGLHLGSLWTSPCSILGNDNSNFFGYIGAYMSIS